MDADLRAGAALPNHRPMFSVARRMRSCIASATSCSLLPSALRARRRGQSAADWRIRSADIRLRPARWQAANRRLGRRSCLRLSACTMASPDLDFDSCAATSQCLIALRLPTRHAWLSTAHRLAARLPLPAPVAQARVLGDSISLVLPFQSSSAVAALGLATFERQAFGIRPRGILLLPLSSFFLARCDRGDGFFRFARFEVHWPPATSGASGAP